MPVAESSKRRRTTTTNCAQLLLLPLMVLLILSKTMPAYCCSSSSSSTSAWAFRRRPMLFQAFVHRSSSSSSSFRRPLQDHGNSNRRWCNFLVGVGDHRMARQELQRYYTVGSSTVRLLKTTTTTTTATHLNDNNNYSYYPHRVYLAVGSNLGNRFQNIQKALQLLCHHHQPRKGDCSNNDNNSNSTEEKQQQQQRPVVRLMRTSFLYETAPMYVTDQPVYLNGAVEVQTSLSPNELLDHIKDVEQEVGRNLTASAYLRNGPRPIDLDILLYYDNHQMEQQQQQQHKDNVVDSTANHYHHQQQQHQQQQAWIPHTLNVSHLEIPHPRIQEREFVLRPLCDVAGSKCIHPILNQSLGELLDQCCSSTTNKDDDDAPPAVRVLPLRPRLSTTGTTTTDTNDNRPRPIGERFLSWNQTLIMGILNVTPDSFSDAGKWNQSIDLAIQHARQLENDGASIIDVGGESTRPGADEISMQVELERTIPVIQGIRQYSDIPISIDTRRAAVARAAVQAGADIVNDVSGGLYDPDMFSTVADLRVPMIIMHMRGTPQTMQNMTQYNNGNVVDEVAAQLVAQSQAAEQVGIHKWQQIIDPGIGFAKDLEGNLSLLKHTARLREAVGDLPMLLGTSRKGFIGKLAGVTTPEDRDYGTVASCVAALCLEHGARNAANDKAGTTVHPTTCNILRVHNVAAARQAVLVMDAIQKAP